MPKLYHKDVLIPQEIEKACRFGVIRLRYTNHARMEMGRDRYDEIVPPVTLDTNCAEIIEVETLGNRLIKVVYRDYYDEDFDICYAINMGNLAVKTVWLNRRDDQHATLKTSVYIGGS